jgi:hypothetical protein
MPYEWPVRCRDTWERATQKNGSVVSPVCSEGRGMSVILVAWQGKAKAQRRRGTFHGLKLKPETMTAGNSPPRCENSRRHYNCCGVVGKRTDTALRIRRMDQAPHEPRAGIRHWRLHPGCAWVRCPLVGVYENKEFIFVAKVKEGFVPRIRDEIFPALKTLQTAQCPFKNPVKVIRET